MSAPLLPFAKRAPGRSRDSAPHCTRLRRSLHANASARNVLDEPTRGDNRVAATLVTFSRSRRASSAADAVTSDELMVEGTRSM